VIKHTNITTKELYRKIKQREICFGGYFKLRIYGTLQCKSGKRIKPENRVFFSSESEAIKQGFRPCGHCMKEEYQKWKNGPIQ
jgi:methylphosphotriester-DNA--protein-cysteine methyltransferase